MTYNNTWAQNAAKTLLNDAKSISKNPSPELASKIGELETFANKNSYSV
jgi:hypothetical protein